MKFRTLLIGHHDEHTLERITDALDRMDPKSRLFTAMSIEPAEQEALWELCKDNDLTSEHFVPSGTEPLKEVIHHGRNTLPAHNFFQKRFCRIDEESDELGGYNEQSLKGLTGPGYYIAHGTDDEKEPPAAYVIDYTRLPEKKADGWPDILPQSAKLGRFVYAGMKDYMRGVSEHVSIGRAYKGGKPVKGAFFILCREDPPEEE